MIGARCLALVGLGLILGPRAALSGNQLVMDGPRGRVVIDASTGDAQLPAELPGPSAKSMAWRPLLEAIGLRHGVDPALLEAVAAVESNFDPAARSHAGAQGLMQLMPATSRHLGLDDPLDPALNLDAGARHLAALLADFDGDERLAVAAYNAGPGAVRRARGVPSIPETRRYVVKIAHYLEAMGQPREWTQAASWQAMPVQTPQRPRNGWDLDEPRGRSSVTSIANAAASDGTRTLAGQLGGSDSGRVRLVRDARGRLVMTNLPASGAGTRETTP